MEPSEASWATFDTSAPGVASDVRALIERHRFALMGTIGRDGTPRISPVELHLVGEDLTLALIPRTRKADDLRRDDRVVLQSPITDAGDPGTEFKLRGRAREIADERTCAAIADAVEGRSGWRPRPDWFYVAVSLEAVACIRWRTDGTGTLSRWSARNGASTTSEMRLDMERGAYVRD